MFELLQGSKTYIIGGAMIIVGIYNQDIEMILQGVGLMTLRAGVAKI